jgi:hypothetical protein
LRIAEAILVQVKQMQAQAVLDFAFTEIMQARLPMPVLAQVLRHVRGQENMSGIAAIHDALRQINSRTGYVRFLVYIRDSVDRTAVNSHPQQDLRLLLQGSADLESTSRRFFRTVEESERHPIAGRHSDEFAPRFRGAKAFRISHDLLQRLQQFNLLVHEQL